MSEVILLKARKWILRTLAVLAALVCIAGLISRDWWTAVILLAAASALWRASTRNVNLTTATTTDDYDSPGLDNFMDSSDNFND